MLALERGPIVFCLEGKDLPDSTVFNKFITPDTQISATYEANLLNGVMVLSGGCQGSGTRRLGERPDLPRHPLLYLEQPRCRPDGSMDSRIQGIRYPDTRTDHSQQGTDVLASYQATTDVPAATSNLQWAWGYNDQWEPKRSSDTSKPYHYWWLRQGSKENVCYRFSHPPR